MLAYVGTLKTLMNDATESKKETSHSRLSCSGGAHTSLIHFIAALEVVDKKSVCI